MTRKWGVILLTSILVSGGLVTAVVVADASLTDRGRSVAQASAAIAETQDKAENDDDDGGGPPPWAHPIDQGKGHAADKAWKEAWKKLTPAQKQKKMGALIRAHEQGMMKWADCVAAAGNDASKRATCLKPLPPGLAKKLP